MGRNNETVAHDFYYHGVNLGKSGEYSGIHISYRGMTAYSYSTAVAQVIPAKGKTVKDINTGNADSAITLVSMDSMTSTTGKHLCHLRGASPFRVIKVPMQRGGYEITPDGLKRSFLEKLLILSKQLNDIKYRRLFCDVLLARSGIIKLASDKWARALKGREFKKFDELDVAKYAKEQQAKNRAAASKAAAETRKFFKEYAKDRTGKDYIELVFAIFDPLHYNGNKYVFSKEARAKLKAKLHFNDEKAYVWVRGADVVTSKRISIPVYAAKVALRAWARGTDMRKYVVNGYSVVKYEGDEIQIGCHHIPRENMLALYETLMGEPFPEKGGKCGR